MGFGTVRRWALAATGVTALGLGGATFAWACTAQPVTFFGSADGAAAGPAGHPVTVRGENWTAGRPVEIRWNSPTGGVLVSTPQAMGPEFSVSVTIPADARPGVHTIYFLQYERPATGGGQAVTGTARLPFEVTRSAGGSTGPGSAGQGSTNGSNATSTNGAEAEETRQSSGSTAENYGNLGSPAGEPAAGTTPVGSDASSAASPAAQASPESRSTGTGSVTASSPNQSDQRATSGAATSAGVAQPAQAVPGDERSAAGPAVRTATSDLWSGFSAGAKGSLVPSLSGAEGGSAGPGSSLAIGFTLLGAGMLTMLGGFGIAEVRRKRALASRRSDG